MTPEEFKALGDIRPVARTISVSDLIDHSARTLIFGWTCDRNDFHIYVYKRRLHKFCYDWNNKELFYKSGTELPLECIVPDKRILPNCCDYMFCRRLIEKGVYLPWATMAAQGAHKPYGNFYGRVKHQ